MLLTLNYLVLDALTRMGVALLPAKVFTELALVSVSSVVQRHLVFAPGSQRAHKIVPTREQVR